jgi:hypothetical protein
MFLFPHYHITTTCLIHRSLTSASESESSLKYLGKSEDKHSVNIMHELTYYLELVLFRI